MERDTQKNLLSLRCPWAGVRPFPLMGAGVRPFPLVGAGVRPFPLVGAGVGLHRQLR